MMKRGGFRPRGRRPQVDRRPHTRRHLAAEMRRKNVTRGFVELAEAIRTIGHAGAGFSFDNEGPAHRVLVGPVRVARSLVTNGEWLAFMREGGYDNPALWLSDGWAAACAEQWRAPGYWREIDGAWFAMTLGGLRAIDPGAPVCHVSYYEADAFARWSGRHLPSEAEWETAAQTGELDDAFGVVWQWTRSAYAPYPGFRAAGGALGEYNGKFMVNQMVLRGSSFATPDGHARHHLPQLFLSALALAIHRAQACRALRLTQTQASPGTMRNTMTAHARVLHRVELLRCRASRLPQGCVARPRPGSEAHSAEIFL